MKLRSIFVVVGLLLTSQLTHAEESATESAIINTNELAPQVLESYITTKAYTKVVIDDSYGKLLYESQVVTYQPQQLNKFYKKKICDDVYWFNCSYNLSNLQEYTNVDLDSESGLFTANVESIVGYKVNYTTQDLDNTARNVSGAVLIPSSNKPLKGVVLFYHYTVLNNRNVPSSFGKDETKLSPLMAASLASAGYVVVMPDYIGQGDDESAVHPYILYPQVNALSGIYMLKLIAQLKSDIRYQLVNQKVPVYISGYSEGGAYALWAAKILQDNPRYLTNYGFNLSKAIPISGAYNLSNATFRFLTEESELALTEAPYFVQDKRVANFMRPALVADVMNAYTKYNLQLDASSGLVKEFYACKACGGESGFSNLSEVFSSSKPEFVKYKTLYSSSQVTNYGESNDSVLPLANPDVLSSRGFYQQLISADIYNWKSNVPVDFLTLEHDSVVPRLNSETAYYAMAKQGSSKLNITMVPNQNFKASGYIPFTDINIDHGSGIPFMFLFLRKSIMDGVN